MKLFWIVCIALIGLFLFFFALGYGCFLHAFRRKKSYPAERTEHGGGCEIPDEGLSWLRRSREWFDAQLFEGVSVLSHDGLRLEGQLLCAKGEGKGVCILFHGYHSSCRRDLSVQAMTLWEAGYHLILVSERSHGASEGKYFGFGALERRDVGAWCCLASHRFEGLPISLVGLSMGAATVLMSLNTPLPDSVRCVIADCPFTSPWEIVRHNLRHKHKLPPVPTVYFMNYWCRLLAGYDLRDHSVADSLLENTRPVLLIHGEADRYVPTEMSDRIAAVDRERITYLRIAGAKHAQAVYFDPEGYRARMLSFLEANVER